ncbi:hypothetical protein [Nitrospirillum viridazoti]|uniref:hypothetical protein n=1 Tax=Nitrospirillum viridazoti TaxID=3144925 RepID=UPI00119F195E|nr:hypothetical protein [Nitrospirillum amazonense]
MANEEQRVDRARIAEATGEFRRMLETLHLLRSPVNADRLRKSIAAADAGRFMDFPPLVAP